MAKEFVVRISAPSPSGKSPLQSRESNESYFYPVTRAVSFWPQVNGNGAFFQEHLLAPLVNSSDEEDGFVGKLVNIWHKKGVGTGNQIIGAIKDQAVVPGSGIDLMARIDRKAADVYGITPDDFNRDGEYSASSIEILCDWDKSIFVAMTNPGSDKLEDQTTFTAQQAEEMGMTRTAETGYKYQDKYDVVEGVWPLRCRGLAFMDDPADPTAQVFELAASMNVGRMKDDEIAKYTPHGDYGDHDMAGYADSGLQGDGKPRYPTKKDGKLDPERIRAAWDYIHHKEDAGKYTASELKTVKSNIARAAKAAGVQIDNDEQASFSDDFGPLDTPFEIGDGGIGKHYSDITCDEMCEQEQSVLPEECFASAYTTADGHARVKKLPLYRSKADFEKGKPDKGLVKAAIHALRPTYEGGVDLHPNLHAEARNKVRTAHKQLFPQGDNQVDPKEKEAIETAAFERGVQSKADEIAALKTQVETLTSERDAAKAETAEVQAKHDEIAAKLTAADEENATLKTAAAEKAAEELAAKRFAELEKIEGFSAGNDEEKASLLATLKTEDETAFKLRHNDETIASLTRKIAAGPAKPAAEEQATAREEQASRRIAQGLSLDAMPVYGAKDNAGKEIDVTDSIM